MGSTKIEMIGKRFGRLTVVEQAPSRMYGNPPQPFFYWRCECDCGNTSVVEGRSLRKGAVKSCKCLAHELTVRRCYKHGNATKHTVEYRAWARIWQVCTNTKHPRFKDYGARGITVDKEWKDFRVFLSDMGKRPVNAHSLNRIDNDGNYNKSNCEWASLITQANNKRNTIFLTYLGETRTVRGWHEKTGISMSKILSRYRKGWDTHRILTKA